jgi:predicted membrane-bound spermidine synthase
MAAAGSILYDTAISEAIGLRWLEWAGYVVVIAALVGFPISIGIAIVRYRLYEIDTLINRTLVYGSLTAILVAIYFGAVVLLQRLFVALTGEKSTLAVVVSTLVIVALFPPLRHRIQGFIDRRFYRRKYDARKTLDVFSAKLRDETDLDALSEDLLGVVRETMQPAHVGLWLRPDRGPKSGGNIEPRG